MAAAHIVGRSLRERLRVLDRDLETWKRAFDRALDGALGRLIDLEESLRQTERL